MLAPGHFANTQLAFKTQPGEYRARLLQKFTSVVALLIARNPLAIIGNMGRHYDNIGSQVDDVWYIDVSLPSAACWDVYMWASIKT